MEQQNDARGCVPGSELERLFPGDREGTLSTPLLRLDGKALSLNVDAGKGRVRAQATDPQGKPIPGFAFADCKQVTGDTLAARLAWKEPLSALLGKTIRLELALERARLFALEVHR
jgi:hypothetical protein